MHCSTSPPPEPPYSSGIATPSQPSSAMRAYSCALCSSTALSVSLSRCSRVPHSRAQNSRIASANACCSSVNTIPCCVAVAVMFAPRLAAGEIARPSFFDRRDPLEQVVACERRLLVGERQLEHLAGALQQGSGQRTLGELHCERRQRGDPLGELGCGGQHFVGRIDQVRHQAEREGGLGVERIARQQ